MQATELTKAIRKIGMFFTLFKPSENRQQEVVTNKPREKLAEEYMQEEGQVFNGLMNSLNCMWFSRIMNRDDCIRGNLGFILLNISDDIIIAKLGISSDWSSQTQLEKVKTLNKDLSAVFFDISAISLVKSDEVKNLIIANADEELLDLLAEDDLGATSTSNKKKICGTVMIAIAMYFGELSRTTSYVASFLGPKGIEKVFEVIDGTKQLSLKLFDDCAEALDFFTEDKLDDIFLSVARAKEILAILNEPTEESLDEDSPNEAQEADDDQHVSDEQVSADAPADNEEEDTSSLLVDSSGENHSIIDSINDQIENDLSLADENVSELNLSEIASGDTTSGEQSASPHLDTENAPNETESDSSNSLDIPPMKKIRIEIDLVTDSE